MSDHSESARFDRRQFTKQLAAISGAATTLVFSPSESQAEGNAPATGQDKNPVEPQAERPNEDRDRPARPSEEILLLNLLIQRYPSEKFDDAAMRGIYGELRSDLARSRVLSDFPLKNSDEPNYVFRAYRAPA